MMFNYFSPIISAIFSCNQSGINELEIFIKAFDTKELKKKSES